jgi:hypothetical protein
MRQNSYVLKSKTLLKEMDRHVCLCIRKLNTAKISVLPTVIYRFSAIPINIPMMLFSGKRKILKFT